MAVTEALRDLASCTPECTERVGAMADTQAARGILSHAATALREVGTPTGIRSRGATRSRKTGEAVPAVFRVSVAAPAQPVPMAEVLGVASRSMQPTSIMLRVATCDRAASETGLPADLPVLHLDRTMGRPTVRRAAPDTPADCTGSAATTRKRVLAGEAGVDSTPVVAGMRPRVSEVGEASAVAIRAVAIRAATAGLDITDSGASEAASGQDVTGITDTA